MQFWNSHVGVRYGKSDVRQFVQDCPRLSHTIERWWLWIPNTRHLMKVNTKLTWHSLTFHYGRERANIGTWPSIFGGRDHNFKRDDMITYLCLSDDRTSTHMKIKTTLLGRFQWVGVILKRSPSPLLSLQNYIRFSKSTMTFGLKNSCLPVEEKKKHILPSTLTKIIIFLVFVPLFLQCKYFL